MAAETGGNSFVFPAHHLIFEEVPDCARQAWLGGGGGETACPRDCCW